jgi:hypothetical protein
MNDPVVVHHFFYFRAVLSGRNRKKEYHKMIMIEFKIDRFQPEQQGLFFVVKN